MRIFEKAAGRLQRFIERQAADSGLFTSSYQVQGAATTGRLRIAAVDDSTITPAQPQTPLTPGEQQSHRGVLPPGGVLRAGTRITVQSGPYQGQTFMVTLPVQEDPLGWTVGLSWEGDSI